MIDLTRLQLGLAKKGLSPKTIRAMVALAKSIQCEPELQWFQDFILKKHNEGVSNGYINLIVALGRSVATIYGLSWGKRLTYWNVGKRTKIMLTESEIKAFLNCDGYKIPQVKVKWDMFWSLMVFTGMRPGEVAQLQKHQIDLAGKVIRLELTKTKPRDLPIPTCILDQLSDYLKFTDDWLFPANWKNKEKHVGRPGWRDDFHNRLKKCGIDKKATPHSLRHSFISRLLGDSEANLYDVMGLVGHQSVKTTEIYFHPSIRTLRKAIEKDVLSEKKDTQTIFTQIVEFVRQSVTKDFDVKIEQNKQSLVIDISV